MNEHIKICDICNVGFAAVEIKNQHTGEKTKYCFECIKEEMKKGKIDENALQANEFMKQVVDSFEPNNKNKGSKKENNENPKNQYPIPTKNNGMNNFRNTPTLDSLSIDLTEEVRKGRIDKIIGRDEEIKKTIRTLSRRTKSNPVIVGEPGVGKTSIVEGVAQLIVEGKVPENLKDKRIVSLNIGGVVAGTKYRGEFEDRLKKIIAEVVESENVILFIDEIHTIIGAGGAEGAIDASNLLKPELARGKIKLIGATTLDEYRKYIEKDAALERRFQKIDISETSPEDTKKILQGIKGAYQKFHGIEITEEAINAAVELSVKYISDRFLPDKAIDLMDEACSDKKIKNEFAKNEKPKNIIDSEEKVLKYIEEKDKASMEQDFERAKQFKEKEDAEEEKLEKLLKKFHKENEQKQKEMQVIGMEDIAFVVSEWTGIPAQQLSKEEKQRLKTLANDLGDTVKGQDEAIEAITKAIKRNKMGLKDPKRPAGVFMLLGPTGVGKTELAKAVAKNIYGTEDNMIRFDMSEFMEKHSVSKLIGSPPGYVGYDDEGKLTKTLRRKPYSLVLFDEVEKASPDVFNVMLQLYEEGRITDSKGRVVDAKNAIFLMTSNIGSEHYTKGKKSMNFIQEDENEALKDKVMKSLEDQFRPELINRIDDIIIFNKLERNVMGSIAEKMMVDLEDLLKEQEITLKYNQELIDYLVEKGFDEKYGARPLRKQIDVVKDKIADLLLEHETKKKVEIKIQEKELIVK